MRKESLSAPQLEKASVFRSLVTLAKSYRAQDDQRRLSMITTEEQRPRRRGRGGWQELREDEGEAGGKESVELNRVEQIETPPCVGAIVLRQYTSERMSDVRPIGRPSRPRAKKAAGQRKYCSEVLLAGIFLESCCRVRERGAASARPYES